MVDLSSLNETLTRLESELETNKKFANDGEFDEFARLFEQAYKGHEEEPEYKSLKGRLDKLDEAQFELALGDDFD
jgi:hypothetical protein